jgi:hypothetical protein
MSPEAIGYYAIYKFIEVFSKVYMFNVFWRQNFSALFPHPSGH